MSIINKLAFLGKTIVIHNDKGGVGKSTLSINIAFAIHQMAGLKGQLVDTDPQKTSVTFMDTRLLAGDKSVKYVARDTAVKANYFIEREDFEYIVFDTQGADSPAGRETMQIADYLIIPVNASGFVVSKLEKMLEKAILNKYNNEEQKAFIVFNMVEKKNKALIRKHKMQAECILNKILEKYGVTKEEIEIYICESSISSKPALYDEMNDGKTIFEIATGKTLEDITAEYTGLLSEIESIINNKIEVAA
ncbi:ParA family protein [Pseudomonas sp. NBRC 111118]|uniref:ParA family protein n=1 Tax=Pseudomonas sp. NBRC 111118 TaxID=1661033 RepID=UPI0006D3C515|nr:ParA family protein [Pseudomonas sp. NBRC 111118]